MKYGDNACEGVVNAFLYTSFYLCYYKIQVVGSKHISAKQTDMQYMWRTRSAPPGAVFSPLSHTHCSVARSVCGTKNKALDHRAAEAPGTRAAGRASSGTAEVHCDLRTRETGPVSQRLLC